MNVVRMTGQQLRQGDRYSVVILVEDEEPESEPVQFLDLFRNGITLLLIRVSLESRDIVVYECYQINNPSVEHVVNLVRDFGSAHLKKKDKKNASISASRKMALLSRLQRYPDSLASDG